MSDRCNKPRVSDGRPCMRDAYHREACDYYEDPPREVAPTPTREELEAKLAVAERRIEGLVKQLKATQVVLGAMIQLNELVTHPPERE